jgi:hypothetical protein
LKCFAVFPAKKNECSLFELAKVVDFGRLCFVCFVLGALREAHFRRPRAKREKKKSAGAEKRNAPRNEPLK